MEKVVIVGAGITGAGAASLLRKNLQQNVKIKIVDKSRGTGGRMATSRSSMVKNSSVDLGAQYISVTPENALKHKSLYEELFTAGLLQPLKTPIDGNRDTDGTTSHYVTPKGIGSVVKHFLQKSDAEMKFDQLINRVDVEGDKIKLTSQTGATEECDAVVLTMPVPQILQLQGSIKDLIDSNSDVKQKLENVTYSSRFCLGLFYNPGTKLDYTWAGKYVYDNPCVRFVAIDNKKRGLGDEVAPSVLLHTSVPFSLENLETDKEVIKPVLMKHLQQVLPDLPEPVEVKSHKWRYSQVHHGYSGSPGCVVLCNKPLIILAGDGFTHSNLDGCWDSVLSVSDTFLKLAGKL